MNEKKSKNAKMIRMCVDIAMVILMPLLMAYSLVGELLHEIIGVSLFVLFITHHVLNRKWLSSLKQGKWTALRVVNTAVNVLMFLLMLAMMVSALIISNYLFVSLKLGGAAIGRVLHLVAANWLFVLMSLHLGLHMNTVSAYFGIGPHKTLRRVLSVFFALIAVYGCYAMIKRSMPSYLFLTQFFAFLDDFEPVVFFLLDYVSIMVFFAVAAFWGARLLTLPRTRQSKEDGPKAAKAPKKKRLKVLLILAALALVAGIVWGVPYLRRHFKTVTIDSKMATAMPAVELSGRTLTVQFTRVGNTDFDPDVDAVSSASLMLDENGSLVGNAGLIAQMVQNAVGGDVYPIHVKEHYPSSYADTISVASREFKSSSFPELTGSDAFPDTAAYERMILVFPLWWSTVPKAVEAYLSQQDLSGLKVYLILTHGGGGKGSVPADLSAMLRGAVLDENILLIYDDDADEAAGKVYEWLKTID